MIVQSEISWGDSCASLVPAWAFGGCFCLEVDQITGMCPALCYALRLPLLSHNVSLRFQSIMVPSFSVYFRGNVHNKSHITSSGAELFSYTFAKISIIQCHSHHQLTLQRHLQHSCWNMSLFRLDGVCASKFHWEECAIYIIYLPSACSRVAFSCCLFLLVLT